MCSASWALHMHYIIFFGSFVDKKAQFDNLRRLWRQMFRLFSWRLLFHMNGKHMKKQWVARFYPLDLYSTGSPTISFLFPWNGVNISEGHACNHPSKAYPPWNQQFAPENSPKRKLIVFQLSILRCELSKFREGNLNPPSPSNKNKTKKSLIFPHVGRSGSFSSTSKT